MSYEQGFIEKCAQYGVDPYELLKWAHYTRQTPPPGGGSAKQPTTQPTGRGRVSRYRTADRGSNMDQGGDLGQTRNTTSAFNPPPARTVEQRRVDRVRNPQPPARPAAKQPVKPVQQRRPVRPTRRPVQPYQPPQAPSDWKGGMQKMHVGGVEYEMPDYILPSQAKGWVNANKPQAGTNLNLNKTVKPQFVTPKPSAPVTDVPLNARQQRQQNYLNTTNNLRSTLGGGQPQAATSPAARQQQYMTTRTNLSNTLNK